MTATPRIWQEQEVRGVAEGVRDRLPAQLVASMDDESVFGPVLYRLTLASAVSRGLLARYQIIVMELADPLVTPERLMGAQRREEEVRGQRLAALQAGLLRAMAEHGLQATVTFHHRTIEAQAFAEGLPAVAAKLHTDDPRRYPERMWSGWLQGEHASEQRQRVLGGFASTARRAVLSNCRVLGEGVDIRAVDSVALLDPKGAPHEIVQAVGRALRQKPGQGKVASLIVPIFRPPGQRGEQELLCSGAYRPLVKVLQGLRAHDEEAVESLAIPQAAQKSSVQPSVDIGPGPEEGEAESRLLLRFAAPRDPVAVARWVSFNIIEPERQAWQRGWEAARRYREREGHLLVPYDHREGAEPLGQWIAEQRRAYTAGQMTGARAGRLEQLEMVWHPGDAAFAENLAAARVYYRQHGTLCAPRTASALGRPVGQWLSNLRRPGALEGHPQRAEALAAIDAYWNPPWPVVWQRTYAAMARLLAEGATLEELLPGVTVNGTDIGTWLGRQRQPAVWQGLSGEQRRLLQEVGVTAQAAPKAPQKARGGRSSRSQRGSRTTAFERGLVALRQYQDRTGSLTVPRGHVEELETGWDGNNTPRTAVKLGVWLSNTRARRTKLTREQLNQLANLGLDLRQPT